MANRLTNLIEPGELDRVSNPDWRAKGFSPENFIPKRLRELWDNLGDEARFAAWIMAREQADNAPIAD